MAGLRPKAGGARFQRPRICPARKEVAGVFGSRSFGREAQRAFESRPAKVDRGNERATGRRLLARRLRGVTNITGRLAYSLIQPDGR
jgi:hypothetical protein